MHLYIILCVVHSQRYQLFYTGMALKQIPVADPGGGGGGGGLAPPFQSPANIYIAASRSQTLARMSGYVRLRLAVLTAYTCKLIG